MELPPIRATGVLASKGVAEIFHANSVITACHFLRHGALLSRGSVERLGLYQTDQKSDVGDRKFGIWYDVFCDSVDIHFRGSRLNEYGHVLFVLDAGIINEYGPVLFVLDAGIIKTRNIGKLWVTKSNPLYWENKTKSERWFESIAELEADFTYGRYCQHIVFRHCGGQLPLRSHLKAIVLDDPKKVIRGVDLFSMAFGALSLALEDGNIDVPIYRRICKAGCKCLAGYESKAALTRRMFVPHNNAEFDQFPPLTLRK
jgi:hypothetical protein